MALKAGNLRFPIFFFLFVFFFSSACSTPSWFPMKGDSSKTNKKELADKEVVLIDKEEYVKVANPKASESNEQSKYIYVPVAEYLSHKDAYATVGSKKEEPKKLQGSSPPSPSPSTDNEVFTVSPVKSSVLELKRKVVITHFDDRTTTPDEMFGDWVSEKLMKEVDRRSRKVLFVDYLMIKGFLEQRGINPKDLETPTVLRLLNEVFGINAIVSGYLSGPYVFTTKTGTSQEGTASAIIRIEMDLVETQSGKILKHLSATNPFFATKEKGSFPEERAKMKAIDLTLSELSGALSREIDGLDWSCRIVKVEGEDVYLNAGRQTGLKVGDIMEVFRPSENGDREQTKGRVRISAFLGIDASVGMAMDLNKPDVKDVVRLAKGEGM
jgi:hypothetical protein